MKYDYADIFFKDIKFRSKKLPSLPFNFKGRFWHVGIIYKRIIYETFNNGEYNMETPPKNFLDDCIILPKIKINIDKLNKDIDSGVDCVTYVCRVTGIDKKSKNNRRNSLYPEDIYNILVEDFKNNIDRFKPKNINSDDYNTDSIFRELNRINGDWYDDKDIDGVIITKNKINIIGRVKIKGNMENIVYYREKYLDNGNWKWRSGFKLWNGNIIKSPGIKGLVTNFLTRYPLLINHQHKHNKFFNNIPE